MLHLSYAVPIFMGIALVVLTILLARQRLGGVSTPEAVIPPVHTILPAPPEPALPPHYDAILRAACLEAIRSQRPSLDEGTLLAFLALSRAIKNQQLSVREPEEAMPRNVIEYRANFQREDDPTLAEALVAGQTA